MNKVIINNNIKSNFHDIPLSDMISTLGGMGLRGLREAWLAKIGEPVPLVSAATLRMALAYEMQKEKLGGVSLDVIRRFETLEKRGTLSAVVRPGMRFVREWKGVLHVVTIDEAGSIIWKDRKWRSLSQVAREITGTSWSGPVFFGLVERIQAA